MKDIFKIHANGQWSLSKSTDDAYYKAIADRAASRTLAASVPEFLNDSIRQKGHSTIKDNTHTRVNPDTGEEEYLLFRGTHAHDDAHLKDGKASHPYANTWTYIPDSARGYGESPAATNNDTREPKIIAAFIPKSKIKNVLSAHGVDPGHGEVIVHPLKDSPIDFEQVSLYRKDKPQPFGLKIGLWPSAKPKI